VSELPSPPGDVPGVSVDATSAQRDWIPHRPDGGGRQQRTGCGFALVLAVLAFVGVVGIALAVVAFRGSDGITERSPSDLVVGNCLTRPGAESGYMFELAGCDEAHDDEVFAVGHLNEDGESPYPALEDLQRRIESLCTGAAFADYVGIDAAQSSYRVLFITPDAQAWRTTRGVYVCLIDGGGQVLRGSARGTGR
jgi:hypothetical protein